VSSLTPLIAGRDADDVEVSDLQIDGGIPEDEIDAGIGPGVYLWHCQRPAFRNLYVHHVAADGVGFEISHHALVENCRLEHCFLPLHAGSGSMHAVFRKNRLRNNVNGFYFCWGIEQALLEENEFCDSRNYGVSIGFRDSRNVVRRNVIRGNGQVGVLFRKSHHPHQSPQDDLIEENLIEDNGPSSAPLGVLMEDAPDELTLVRNTIRETRGAGGGVAIRIGEKVGAVHLEENTIAGFDTEIEDLRASAKDS
jgi:nitrous oxidase accessory protein NosD